MSKNEKYLLLIFVIFLLVFHFLTFKKYPAASIDESWISSDAMAIVDKSFVKMDHPFFEDNSGLLYLPKLILGNYYKIFGLGFVQGRLFILSFSFLLLFFFYKFTKEFFGKTAAILAIVYFASTNSFLFSSHLIRFDVHFVIFLLLSLRLFFLYLKSSNVKYLFWSGLFLGFSQLFQTMGVLFQASFIVAWAGIWLINRKFNLKHFIYFSLGLFVYWIFYLLVYVLPGVSRYITSHSYFFFVDHPFPILSLPLNALIDAELFRYKNYFYPEGIVELSFIIISLVWGIKSQDYLRKFLAGYVLISALLFFFFASNKGHYYFIYLLPFASICLVLFFLDLWKLRHKFFLYFLFFIIGFNYFRQFKVTWEYSSYNYLKIYHLIAPHLSPNSKVLGEALYWLPLKDYRYANISLLTWYRIDENLNAYEALSKINPDFIIVDPYVEGKLVEDESQISPIDFQRGLHKISKKQFNRYLEENAILVTSYNSEYYFGEIKLYKVKK